jgi:hypothetical protein
VVTGAQVQLELRPSRGARAWEVAFPIVMAGFFLFVGRPDGAGQWTVVAVLLALTCVQGWRWFRLAAIGTDDGRLLVRNLYRDRWLDRRDIAEVEVAPRVLGRAVRLRLEDDSRVWMDVTPARARLEEQAAELRAWLDDQPPQPAA